MSRVVQLVLVAVAVVGVTVTAQAQSIGINFGADEPDPADAGNSSHVTGPAGVLGAANWNNFEGAAGGVLPLVDDSGALSGANVEWASNNTWASVGRSESNNTAPPGDDMRLMQGYLDTTATSTTTVHIEGVPYDVYDVILYLKGGVIGRGGEYAVNGEMQNHVDTAPFDGTYVLGSDGDYLQFGPFSSPILDVTTHPTTTDLFRASLNGIEIVAIPEPATLAMLIGAGLLGLGVFWRRKK